MGISNKLDKLYARRSEEQKTKLFSATEASDFTSILPKSLRESEIKKLLKSSGLSENEYWIFNSMKEVGDDYRRKSYQEADRIVKQLHNKGITNIDINYQGSVTNNTCIKYASDIDLLIIIQDFITMEPPLKAENPYSGDPLRTLKILRNLCENIIQESFPTASIDAAKSKCIHVSGGSFKREIDVVICNWVDTVTYQEHLLDFYRGINVLDICKNTRIKNFPFLHNELLNKKDSSTNGGYKKFVRLVKSIKSDADDVIDVSSYDLTSLLYHMEDDIILESHSFYEILENIEEYFIYLNNNYDELAKLFVPNNTVRIIDSLNEDAFIALIKEIRELKDSL
jgi:hypothetical protein